MPDGTSNSLLPDPYSDDIARISPMMPYIAGMLTDQIKSVENRAHALANNDALSPEVALALWFEHRALSQVKKRLETRVATAPYIQKL